MSLKLDELDDLLNRPDCLPFRDPFSGDLASILEDLLGRCDEDSIELGERLLIDDCLRLRSRRNSSCRSGSFSIDGRENALGLGDLLERRSLRNSACRSENSSLEDVLELVDL